MPSHRNVKKVWVSNDSGRSIFGWKIKEEIFAIFFILVILALANDENITKKVSNNTYIQIFVGLVIVYCIYNRIPWSLAFILILLVAILFSGFLNNVKGTIETIYKDIKEKNNNDDNKDSPNPSLMHLGARVFSWMSKDKVSDTNIQNNKSILKKKVRFDDEEPEPSDSADEDDHDEVCKKVSKMFGFSDDEGPSEIDTDNETEPDTDRDTNDQENLKENLKSFMVEKMKN
jgi:hypothetical protein